MSTHPISIETLSKNVFAFVQATMLVHIRSSNKKDKTCYKHDIAKRQDMLVCR